MSRRGEIDHSDCRGFRRRNLDRPWWGWNSNPKATAVKARKDAKDHAGSHSHSVGIRRSASFDENLSKCDGEASSKRTPERDAAKICKDSEKGADGRNRREEVVGEAIERVK